MESTGNSEYLRVNMEESMYTLLKSLENLGVEVVYSIRDFSSISLVSICGQCLNLIHNQSAVFPTTLPDSVLDKLKVCTDMSLTVKKLGFVGEMSYYKFLYPTEEDFIIIISFLVERLSNSPANAKADVGKGANARSKTKEDNVTETIVKVDNQIDQRVRTIIKDHTSTNFEVEDFSIGRSCEDPLAVHGSVSHYTEKPPECSEGAFGYEGKMADSKPQVVSLQQLSSMLKQETEILHSREKGIAEELTAKMPELQHIEEEFKLLKEAAEMALDDQHHIDYYHEQLKQQIDAKKHTLADLESQWEEFRRPLEEKKKTLEESLYANNPKARDILYKLREIQLEKQSVELEIKKREEQHSKLCSDLTKQPKHESRQSYIERIKEITKNSRKQDADIERILKETRELQLESNSTRESLHRAYAFVDELVSREVKRDLVVQQAHKLLTNIHESFEQISEKILAADRVRREIAEHELNLSTIASQSLYADKLEADIVDDKECEHG